MREEKPSRSRERPLARSRAEHAQRGGAHTIPTENGSRKPAVERNALGIPNARRAEAGPKPHQNADLREAETLRATAPKEVYARQTGSPGLHVRSKRAIAVER